MNSKNGHQKFFIGIFFLLVLGFSVGCMDAISAATPLYVDGNFGCDTYDGTSAIYDTGTVGPKKTIQNAINAVDNSGVVNVADWTYNEHLTISKSVTLNGASRENTIIDGTQTGTIITISGTPTVNINHITLRNGKNTLTGGAINNLGNLSITDSTISGNNATHQCGAIYNEGNLSISGSTFSGNSANAAVGAIYNNGVLSISGSTFSGNTANNGVSGAIYNLGDISISGSTFSGNSATTDGGAIYNNGVLSIFGSTFSGNTAANGGAIANRGTISIFGSTFSGNTATDRGGAIVNMDTLSISGSTLIGNTGLHGGAFHNVVGPSILNFNRIIGNNPTVAIDINAGSVDAKNNWWGSNDNPSGKVSAGVDVSKWLVLRSTANPTLIPRNANSVITVDLQHDNGILTDPTHPELYYHNPTMGHIPDGIPVNFSTSLGTIGILSSIVNGTAQSTLYGGNVSGLANVSAKVDNETVYSLVNVDTIAPTAWANLRSGLYNVNKLVSLFMSESGSIYYTTNGLNPSITSAKFISPILIASSTVLKFFAIDTAGNPSTVYTATYNIDKITPKIIYTYPKNSVTRISRTATFYFKFSENIKASTNWSKIYIKNLKTGKKVSIRKWISGRTLYIKTTSRMSALTGYMIYVPYKAVKDYAGNNLLTTCTRKFKTKR